ncbi:MAG: hypothetical protein JNK23_23260 [Opitutaceae bacterium]|nr:hypothetical protein [Opitutaceae bacterium]
MPSSISSFDFSRPIPALPWRGVLIATLLATAAATVAWEVSARVRGYAPTLNDTPDLWSDRREAVKPDSLVIIGDSRPLFDLDLDELEKGFGARPIQLSIAGSCAYVTFEELINDERFRGTVICSIVPGMFFAPGGPLVKNAEDALKRYRERTIAHRAGHHLGMWLEERIAFMKQEDLVLAKLLQKIAVPNRPNSYLPPDLPPYFQTIDRERRTRMIDACAQPGPLQDRVKHGWIPLFTPPPFPAHTPKEVLEGMARTVEERFGKVAALVKKLQARGGKVVFVRFPHSGDLKELEDKATPRSGAWARLMQETGAPNIYYSDHPELIYDCPEWSHLSGPQSVEFTQRLVPHLKKALGK